MFFENVPITILVQKKELSFVSHKTPIFDLMRMLLISLDNKYHATNYFCYLTC